MKVSKNFNSLLTKLINSQPEEAFSKLTQTIPITEIEDVDLNQLIAGLYKSLNSSHKITATVLNAIFVERKATFLLSKRIISKLVEQDTNLKRNTVDSESFVKLIAWWKQTGLIAVVKSGGDDRKASIFELEETDLINKLVKMVGQDYLDAQKTRCIDIFDAYDKTSQGSSHGTSQETSRGSDLGNDTDLDSASNSKVENLKVQEKTDWELHYLKSPIVEQKFNALPANIRTHARTIEDKEDFITFVQKNVPKSFTYKAPLASMCADLGFDIDTV